MRDYLVFVRAGSNSLHREALANDPDRNWDCCVSWYHDGSSDDAVEYQDRAGSNKFDAFVAMHARVLAELPYRYILLLDDDLRFQPGGLSAFFLHCERNGLGLSQPAMAWGTHVNHFLTLRNPVCAVRQVNFVEVMAPCFSRSMLQELLPTFSLTQSTWGIDYAWASLLKERRCMSIVDAVSMEHTKAVDSVNGAFYQYMRRLGIDPEQEYAGIRQRYPAWGPMRTLERGHRYRWPVPGPVNGWLCSWFEKRKIGSHYGLLHDAAQLAGRPA